MTRERAGGVVAHLLAAFPSATLEPESVGLFVDAAAGLRDGEIALEAARSLARKNTRFPALAELLDEYHRIRLERERRELPPAPASPDPELAAEIRAFVEALKVRVGELEPVAFAVAPAGPCDDGCGHVGVRVEAGTRLVCRSCAAARARVAASNERESRHVSRQAEPEAAAA